MKMKRNRAAVMLLPLILLLLTMDVNAQERYWEVLTLFGGDGADTHPFSLLHDTKRDRIIIAGRTMEPDLPVTPDAIKGGLNDMMDGFIAVFNTDCSELLYCSYFGGSDNDAIVDAVFLDEDRLLLALSTYSHDLLTTGTAWASEAPGEHNTWLAVISLESFDLLHAGYFGGSTTDGIDRVRLMQNGNILVSGHAASTDLPVTLDAFQPKKRGPPDSWDAFIAIFDSTFNLTFCSYHGGAVGDGEDARGGVTETENYLVFAGSVLAPDLPVSDDAHQKSFGGGYSDAYMTVVSKDSLRRVYSTYLGGNERDYIHDCIAVSDERVVLVGSTKSPDFPVTQGALQPFLMDSAKNMGDVVIAVFFLEEMRFEEITYIGGRNLDLASDGIYNREKKELSILVTSFSYEFPLLSPKPPDCYYRGVLLNYDPINRKPSQAIPIIDIGKTELEKGIRTADGQLIYCGLTRKYSAAGPVPVHPSGHKTIRTGSEDIFIGVLHDSPVSVESPLQILPSGADIEIFPHPVRRELCFTLESESNGTAILYDLFGRQLRVVTARSDGNHVRGQVALSGIGPGMYMLMVRTEDDVQIRKVIVTK